MSETTFKTPVSEQPQTVTLIAQELTRDGDAPVEVPYLDYEVEHGRPYLVDYFKLGDHWSDLQGGFPAEIQEIDSFLEDQIKSGEIPNDVTSIKRFIAKIERLVNMKDEPRAVIKVSTVYDYVKFLKSSAERKTNLRRLYG